MNVSIIGASGYSGIELLKILKRHVKVEIDKLFANATAGKKISEVAPSLNKVLNYVVEKYSIELVEKSDLIFIALPSGEAMNIVPELIRSGKRIIDLGGDFRLKESSLYEKYYKKTHTAKAELEKSIYGLPEWNKANIKTAVLIANPGCYPTSAILPLAPLLKDDIIESNGIAINSLSGVSGAGRSSSADLSFAEVNESVKAYKVGVHQHIPEISSVLQKLSGKHAAFSFTPHLLPITRGIYTTMYATLKKKTDAIDVFESYNRCYSNAPFVRILENIPEIKNVANTNYIDIGFHINSDNNQIIIMSAIDNLVKGAAGQAVQNMNIMFGYNETEGLI